MTDPDLPPSDPSSATDAGPQPAAGPPAPEEPAPAGSPPDGRSPGDPARGGRARRYLAAFASAIVPGVGHLAYGRRLLALAFLVPTLIAVGVLAASVATGDRAALAARLVDPGVLAWLIAAQVVVLGWRLLAVGSTLLVARPPRYGPRDVLPVVLLAIFVGAPQGYALALTDAARAASLEVFNAADAGPVWRPSTPPTMAPSMTPPPPGETPAPATATPSPSPSPAEPRLTVLLIGEDSGVGRNTALTDTMIVASLDPVARTVSMLSVPRDLVDAPIPGGGVWHEKINSLAAWVRWHPDQFPGSNGSGQAVLAGVISELIDVPIDYWAQVNLGGMLNLVDRVGGVDVTATHGFCDPRYIEYGQHGFAITPGRWHLNGSQALAFARVRKAAGESDFTRAARQQEVLAGLRDAVVRGGFLGDPIGFLQAIGQTVRTNVPPSLLPQVASYAGAIGRDRLYRAVVTYPLVRSGMDVRGSILIPDIAGIRALAARMFPPPGEIPDPSGGGDTAAAAGPSGSSGPAASPSGGSGPPPTAKPAARAPNLPHIACNAPPPAATPRPTATPTPSPALSPESSESPAPSAAAGESGSPEPTQGATPSPTPAGQAAATPSPTVTGATAEPSDSAAP